MKTTLYSLALAAVACGFAAAQTTAFTTPVGYVTQACAANSDTIVSVSLRQPSGFSGAISGAPDTTTTPGSAILSLSGTPGLTVNQFANTHYAKFTSGTASGQFFVVTANAAGSLTVNLNGASLSAASTDQVEVIRFWTLNALFNPASSTTDPLTTGNAIVASTSTLAAGRRTQVLIPDLVGAGINLAPTTTYYVHGGLWKKVGSGNTDFGNDQLWPDTYFIIRNPGAVTSQTSYTIAGEVDTKEFDVGLSTRTTVSQDNFVGLPRPVDATLNSLNLGGTSAFVSSTSTLAAGRRDQLLLFNNATVGQNKAPATTYYYHSGIWKKVGSGNTDFGTDVIPAGNGFIIRKFTGSGATDNWNNTPGF